MKIAISGAHSQGKTTLFEALKKETYFADHAFRGSLTRTLKELGMPINEKGTPATQLFVMAEHFNRSCIMGDVVLDRCVLDGIAYTDAVLLPYNKTPTHYWDAIISLYKETIRKYDIIFYIRPDLPLVDDGVRTVDRGFFNKIVESFNKWKHDAVTYHGANIVEIGGSTEERIQQVYTAIDKFYDDLDAW